MYQARGQKWYSARRSEAYTVLFFPFSAIFFTPLFEECEPAGAPGFSDHSAVADEEEEDAAVPLKPFFEGVFEEVVPVAYSAGRADVFSRLLD